MSYNKCEECGWEGNNGDIVTFTKDGWECPHCNHEHKRISKKAIQITLQDIINFIIIPFMFGWMITNTNVENDNVKAQIKFNDIVIEHIEQQNVMHDEQNSINADLIDTIGAMQQGGY